MSDNDTELGPVKSICTMCGGVGGIFEGFILKQCETCKGAGLIGETMEP